MITLSVVLAVPSCDRTLLIGRIGPIVVVLGALSGCSADAGDGLCRSAVPPTACERGGDAAMESDAGPVSFSDAGASDAGFDPDADGDDESTFGARACSNGLDDDADTLIDCQDTIGCGAASYCCVGSSAAACCTPAGTPVDLVFATCPDGLASACPPGLTAFGSPNPVIEAGAFIPNGDENSDSGLILGARVDPVVDRITFTATFDATIDGCDTATGCLDVVAMGIGDEPSGLGRIEPDIAVVVRASRGDYALMADGEILHAAPLPIGATEYQLDLDPNGTASLRVGSTYAPTVAFVPRRDRTPLLYGRTHNRTMSSEPARATSVRVDIADCEVLDASVPDLVATLPPAGAWGAPNVAAPSFVEQGTSTVAAFEVGGAIHMARFEDVAGWGLMGSGLIDMPILVPVAGTTLEDPELVVEGTRFVIYATQRSATTTSIVRADGGATFGETFGTLDPVALPAGEAPYRSPSVTTWSGALYLAVSSERTGEPAIVLFREATGAFEFANGTLEASTIVVPGDGFLNFDDDEVDDPELDVDSTDLLRIYYAGRRGSRWSIGMVVSEDGVNWRSPNEGAAILSGSGQGHDRVYVRDPSIFRIGGAVELLYTAFDGIRPSIGRAVGAIQ